MKVKTQDYEIELVCLASEVITVKAKSLESARKKAFKKRKQCDFNAYIDDCVKVLDKESKLIIDDKLLFTSFITVEIDE